MENDRTLMSEKILVVDDDEKICQILSLYLRSKGYEVFTCQSGSTGFRGLIAVQMIMLSNHLIQRSLLHGYEP